MHYYVTTPVNRVLRLASRDVFYIETVNSRYRLEVRDRERASQGTFRAAGVSPHPDGALVFRPRTMLASAPEAHGKVRLTSLAEDVRGTQEARRRKARHQSATPRPRSAKPHAEEAGRKEESCGEQRERVVEQSARGRAAPQENQGNHARREGCTSGCGSASLRGHDRLPRTARPRRTRAFPAHQQPGTFDRRSIPGARGCCAACLRRCASTRSRPAPSRGSDPSS